MVTSNVVDQDRNKAARHQHINLCCKQYDLQAPEKSSLQIFDGALLFVDRKRVTVGSLKTRRLSGVRHRANEAFILKLI